MYSITGQVLIEEVITLSFFGNVQDGGQSGEVEIRIVDLPSIVEKFETGEDSYSPSEDTGRLIRVLVGGIEQFEGDGYEMVDNKTFTLNEEFSEGLEVHAIYRSLYDEE